jgi:long-chain fatty acid transport protein
MHRILWLLVVVPSALFAQGFGLYEQGTCAMGRAGVAAAIPCNDGSAIFFNPAGLAGVPGTQLSLGATFVQAQGNFTRDRTAADTDLENPLIPVPNFYFSHAVNSQLGVGLGAYAPYGLETKWPTEGFEGRFLGYNTALRSIYVQPTVAYQPHPRIKVGIGVAYIRSDLELHQRVDLSQQAVPAALATPLGLPAGTQFRDLGIPFGTDFADVTLEGSGSGFAINVGATVQITERLTIGGHWLTHKTIDYEGDATFDPVATNLLIPTDLGPVAAGTPVDLLVATQFDAGETLADGPVRTQITMPSQGSLGLAYRVSSQWTVMADYHYVVWGHFSTLPVDFDRFPNDDAADFELYEGYTDTHGFRFGAQLQQSERTTWRLGYLYHTAAAPDETVTPLLPEGRRHEFTGGMTTALGPTLQLSAAYQYIRQLKRRGRVYDATVGNTGVYSFEAHLVGVGLTYPF